MDKEKKRKCSLPKQDRFFHAKPLFIYFLEFARFLFQMIENVHYLVLNLFKVTFLKELISLCK